MLPFSDTGEAKRIRSRIVVVILPDCNDFFRLGQALEPGLTSVNMAEDKELFCCFCANWWHSVDIV